MKKEYIISIYSRFFVVGKDEDSCQDQASNMKETIREELEKVGVITGDIEIEDELDICKKCSAPIQKGLGCECK
jgi:hypothetical protein